MDLHGGNVLTMEGRLAGIVDWVDAGAGDPATDLGQAMALLPPSRWDSLIHGYGGIDPATFNRARAEALNYALILATVAEPQFAAAGWTALEALGLARRTQ
jgi:aminoglycoside phosphotransferase (APT) family kinase protein